MYFKRKIHYNKDTKFIRIINPNRLDQMLIITDGSARTADTCDVHDSVRHVVFEDNSSETAQFVDLCTDKNFRRY